MVTSASLHVTGEGLFGYRAVVEAYGAHATYKHVYELNMVPIFMAQVEVVGFVLAIFFDVAPWGFFSTHIKVKADSAVNIGAPGALPDIPNHKVKTRFWPCRLADQQQKRSDYEERQDRLLCRL